jgi:ABC-type uncharacterized transport system auxiliary subunit
MVSRRAAVAAAVGVALLLAGCAQEAPPAPPPAPTYEVSPLPVRPEEKALHPVPTTEGDSVFELIGLTTGIKTILGSHAEFPAKGAFIRIRLVVTNNGRNTVPFDANKQTLITADGATRTPDPQAMLIKRQPGQIDIGANDRLEFDLYYDAPPDAQPTALRAFGGATLADFSDTTGVDIPIPTS